MALTGRHSRLSALVRWRRRTDAWVAGHLAWARAGVAVVGLLVLVAAAFVFSGATTVSGRGIALPPTPPSPAAPGADRSPPASTRASSAPAAPTAAASPTGCAATSEHGAGGTVPVHICIPAIGVDADILQVGLNADRTIEVPPLDEVSLAGWYKYSPAPGVLGPSIILGHVDSARYGKGVFFDLGRLHRGDRFSLRRADGMLATFRVDRVAQYPKSAFPTQTVYGNTAGAAIRLITCGGSFDPAAGSYEDNIVAFGTLVSLRPG